MTDLAIDIAHGLEDLAINKGLDSTLWDALSVIVAAMENAADELRPYTDAERFFLRIAADAVADARSFVTEATS